MGALVVGALEGHEWGTAAWPACGALLVGALEGHWPDQWYSHWWEGADGHEV